jgi:hypothetical protein
MTDSGSIPVQETQPSVEKLRSYAEKGFLFHGSPDPTLEVIEPREAKDIDTEASFNNDLAVFGTNRPEIATAFGMIDSAKLPEGTVWRIGQSGNPLKTYIEFPKTLRTYLQTASGYVYVLPSEDFTEKEAEDSPQTKSKTAVKPVDKITIKFEDFERLGGVVRWKEN